MVTSKMYGDVHFGAREDDEGAEGAALTDHGRRFRRAVRTARQEGDLSADAAAVVDAELAQALSHLVEHESVDGFVSAMEGVRRLVDGAPDLVSRADAMIDAARRGAL
jgi:hypothetical protein